MFVSLQTHLVCVPGSPQVKARFCDEGLQLLLLSSSTIQLKEVPVFAASHVALLPRYSQAAISSDTQSPFLQACTRDHIFCWLVEHA